MLVGHARETERERGRGRDEEKNKETRVRKKELHSRSTPEISFPSRISARISSMHTDNTTVIVWVTDPRPETIPSVSAAVRFVFGPGQR